MTPHARRKALQAQAAKTANVQPAALAISIAIKKARRRAEPELAAALDMARAENAQLRKQVARLDRTRDVDA